MKTFVIDASVIIKWIFPEREAEEHTSQALNLLRSIKQNTVTVLQPPHWLAEVVAVIVRLEPKITSESINLLDAMELPIAETSEVYHLAYQLSARFGHHLFDTLYHAVALHHGNATLVTADEQYYKKAHKQKSIIRLADFSIFDD